MSDGFGWKHEAGWGADGRHVAEARAFTTRCLMDHSMSRQADDVRLVVSELVTNAVIHAATAFTLSLRRLDGELTVAVRDGSLERPQQPVQHHATGPQGRGLHLVEALSRSWGVTDEVDGKSVWATFDVAAAETNGG
jgi:anti-sigma regulatory factor (Ser/Thr protein kinase)